MDNFIKENAGMIAGLAAMFMIGFFAGQEYLKYEMKTALYEMSDGLGDMLDALGDFDTSVE